MILSETVAVPEPERFRSTGYRDVLDDAPAGTTCRIAPAALTLIRLAGETGYPHETCGLLIGTFDATAGWEVGEARQVENLNHERAADRFRLDPATYQAIDRELRGSGREIVGVFHSHPDCPAKPSPTDLENSWEGFLYPIISICDGVAAEIHCWAINDASGKFQEIPLQLTEQP